MVSFGAVEACRPTTSLERVTATIGVGSRTALGPPPGVAGDFHRTSHWARSNDARSVALWLFKPHFPLRVGRLARRCAAPHASPAPPCVRASLTCPVPACAGLCHSTCPCCRCSFDGIPGQPQRHLGARAPPCSPGRSRLTSPGAPASAQIGPGSVRALPLARPPLAAPSPTLLSLPACRTTRRPPRGASLDDHTNA